MRAALIPTLLAAAPVAAETAGEALFHRGIGAEVQIAGGVRLPATRFACAGCHGSDGMGRREGGTVFPPILWSVLGDPGRDPSYDRDSFARALRDGIDPAGRPLAKLMPQFRIPPDVLASLTDLLMHLEDSARSGITATALHFAATGDADFDAGLAAFAARFNAQGGAFGRRMVTGGAADTGIPTRALRDRLQPVLAAACRDRLLRGMREDGAQAVRILGTGAAEAAYRATAAGLALSDGAQAVLALPGTDLAAVRDARVYGCLDVLGPDATALAARGNRLTIAVADPDAAGWALSAGQGAGGAQGYQFGRLVMDAVLNAGRAVTVSRIAEGLARPQIVFALIRSPG